MPDPCFSLLFNWLLACKAKKHGIPRRWLLDLAGVCAGGARVIQIGGGTRDLYYYPKDTILVTAISPKLKKGM